MIGRDSTKKMKPGPGKGAGLAGCYLKNAKDRKVSENFR